MNQSRQFLIFLLALPAALTVGMMIFAAWRHDVVQWHLAIRQMAFLIVVGLVTIPFHDLKTLFKLRYIAVVIAMIFLWPTVWRFERGWEDFTYRTHRFTGESFVRVGNEEFPVERSVRPVIKQWYP